MRYGFEVRVLCRRGVLTNFLEIKFPADPESTMAVALTSRPLNFNFTEMVSGFEKEGWGRTELTTNRGGRDGQVRMKWSPLPQYRHNFCSLRRFCSSGDNHWESTCTFLVVAQEFSQVCFSKEHSPLGVLLDSRTVTSGEHGELAAWIFPIPDYHRVKLESECRI